MAHDERALAYAPEPFSAGQFGQLTAFGRLQAEDVGGVWGL